MNKVFCRIWNRALGAYVVASELADRRVRDGRRVRAVVLAIACVPAIASAATQERTVAPSAADPEKIAELVERHLNENERVLAGGALPVWSNAATIGQSRAVSGGVSPMGVIDPGGLTGGTLPGLAQHLTNFLLPTNDGYRACGLLGNGTLLPDECLSIARENFSYAFRSFSVLGVDLLVVPDVLDLNGNRPADHTTIIGRASSGSYINVPNSNYAGQNNDADCLLCVPGVGGTYVWDTLPAQDYQIIVGDGAGANGSNTVVMGTNASHTLPPVSASDLGWSGGPDGNYAARLGNAVVIGHNAAGTADRQTILGANASSVHANSVALGADSVTVRGAQTGYIAPGLAAAQNSAGEVSIGTATAARQLTNVAAGSAATDAVNVAQLQGALADVDGVGEFAVRYDDDGTGAPNFGRVTLDGAGGTAIGNVAAGVAADEAVNVGQLTPVVAALGGGAGIDPTTGAVTGPVYTLDDGSDTGTTVDFGDVGSALDNLDGRTASSTTTINNLLDGTEGLVRQDPATLVVTVGGQTGGDEVSFANAGGDARRLSGVAAGVETTDAVNVGQLSEVTDLVGDLDALAVQYDTDADGNPDYSRVTLAGTGGTAIGNVAAGEVSATSTEAINGAQLFGVAGSVADHLGGGAGVNADGTISAPTYVIRGGNYTNVGDAFDAVDGAFDDLVNDVGDLGATAVRYDTDADGNPDYSRVTLAGTGGTAIGNVAAGVAADEAVNVGQLTPVVAALGGGAGIDPTTGAVTGPVYTLDDGSNTGTTTDFGDVGSALDNLDGRTASNTTTINNLLDGTEGLVRQDPSTLVMTVGGQTGGDEVSFANVDGGARRLSGVAAGVEATDAVNVSQLSDVVGDIDDLGASAVRYDTDADGNPDYSRVTLAGTGGTAIGNVAAGEVSATSSEAINGAQLFGVAGSVADHLGGGAGVNADGTISAPTYVIRGGNYTNVGDAFDAVDGAFDDLVVDVGDLGATAVRYDTDADGNPDYSRVTLAGTGGTAIGNVAAGVAADEAVNVGQLTPVVAALGGGAGIDPTTGAVTGPVYTLDDGSNTGTTADFGDVGSALDNLDGRTASNTTTINNLLDGTEGLVRQDPDTLVMTVGGQTGGDEVSFANVDGDARRLSGVDDGIDDTDAANVRQLRAVEGQIGDLDTFAVRYDAADRAQITLGGSGGTVIDNLAAGQVAAGSLQAINGGQMFASMSSMAAIFGGGASVDPFGGLVAPDYMIQGTFYNSVGAALAALDTGLTQVNTRIDNLPPGTGGGDPLVVVDGVRDGSDDAAVDGQRGVAIGSNASAGGDYGVAIGGDSYAAGGNDTAIGGNAKVYADNSTAVGANATVQATASEAVAVGEGTSVAATGGTAIGQGASVTDTAQGAVALGQGSVADRAGTVSVGTAGGERQVVNVAAGTQDTDAVNVSQLRASEQGTVRYDTNPDGSANPTQITLNRGGGEVMVRNVRAGTAGTDAVNVNQLNAGIGRAIGEANAYTDMRVGQMQSDIWKIDRGYRAGVAAAMAVAGLPQAYMPGKSMVAAAVSGYESEAGLAVGITTISEDGRRVYKFSGTTNTVNDVGFTMGAGLQW
ncbi:YadA-like family protein [Luteimonas sp. S4-F44]|uniref:YadA-like family protein n=1 Tax=Luteimonas sp. S4-F44 TaxID=2925842 RepID=UPI001F5306B3|nr:YadA-like family protein [Luteimonas sp. S4-F44]UNK43119.1 YadA-like family protein [Luteimonas sp. S4-F44]